MFEIHPITAIILFDLSTWKVTLHVESLEREVRFGPGRVRFPLVVYYANGEGQENLALGFEIAQG